MKVTVCFGSTRIVVPVGEGNITVSQLTEKSLARFRKVAKKDPNENVVVHHLHSIADDGILDLDDVLSEVVGDRDVLVAVFDEETVTSTPPLPDIKHLLNQEQWLEKESSAPDSELSTDKRKNDSDYYSNLSQEKDKIAWINKWVQDVDPAATSPAYHASHPEHRGIDIPRIHCDDDIIPPPPSHHSPADSPRGNERSIDSPRGNERSVDTPRGAERGIDAPRGIKRGIDVSHDTTVEDNGRMGGGMEGLDTTQMERAIDAPNPANISANSQHTSYEEESISVEITRETLPFGCNVQHIPNRGPGLYVGSLEPGSAVDRDGRLCIGDKIVEINGVDLTAIPHVSVLDVFHEMTSTALVRLTVTRSPKGRMQPANEPCPPDVAPLSLRDTLQIVLNKGQKGLGFTIATREYTTCPGYSPIFVKTVHRHGAAAADGRMRPNDVLLKVNGKSLVGMQQHAVVAMMKGLKGEVALTLKRRNMDQQPAAAVELAPSPPSRKESPALAPKPRLMHTTTRTRLSLDIPLVAPDGRPVGLGISVKGKSMSIKKEPRQDYGIFIKTILKGGAADLDGRLQADDQLLSTDGQSLKGLANKEAMQLLKQSLERCSKSTSLLLVVARKDCLNMSAEARANKHYSSFKDPAHHGPAMNDCLSADPARYRAMSLSSPNLGRKKKHHVEFDSGRGVAFSEDIQNIPLAAGDVLESDEDVVFVGNLTQQVDPFNRDSLFRKSMKKIDHTPINPNALKRASSHDSLARFQDQKPQGSPVIKRGLSSESIFSGRDVDPVYDTINEDRTSRAPAPAKINDSFQAAVQNGQLGLTPPPPLQDTPPTSEPDKPKSRSFLNFFTKKGNKKRDESRSSDVSVPTNTAPAYTSSPRSTWDIEPGPAARPKHPGNTSTPHLTSNWDHHRRSDRSDQSRDMSTRSVASRDKASRDKAGDNTRDHPRAPGNHRNNGSDDVNHRRSKSSDFYRDKELADRSGLGYLDHVQREPRDHAPREPRDHVRANMSRDHSRDTDRQSNRSHHSSRGEQPGYRQYYQQPRDPPVRDPSRDHPTRDSSRDHPTRDSSRDHTRDKRYMETMGQFRYGRNPHHHGNSPVPQYHDQYHGNDQYYHGNGNARYTGSNNSLTRREERPRHSAPFTPMIPTPISHFTEVDKTNKTPYRLPDTHHYDNLANITTGTFEDSDYTDTDSTKYRLKSNRSTPNVRRAVGETTTSNHRRTGSLPRRHRAQKARARSRDSPSVRSRDYEYDVSVRQRDGADCPVAMHLPYNMLDESFFRDFVPSYTYRNTTSCSIDIDMEPHSPGLAYPRSAPYDMKTNEYYRGNAQSPIFKF